MSIVLNVPVAVLLIYPEAGFRVIAPSTVKEPLLATSQLEPIFSVPLTLKDPVDELLITLLDGFMVTFELTVTLPELLSVHDEPTVKDAKLTVLLAPILNCEEDGFRVVAPPTVIVWFDPAAMVKMSELFICNVPLMVRLADKVSVVEPVIVNEVHAEVTSTVGLLVVAPICTASPATGCPVDGDQLLFVLHLEFVAPVHVYVVAPEVLALNMNASTTRENSNCDFMAKSN